MTLPITHLCNELIKQYQYPLLKSNGSISSYRLFSTLPGYGTADETGAGRRLRGRHFVCLTTRGATVWELFHIICKTINRAEVRFSLSISSKTSRFLYHIVISRHCFAMSCLVSYEYWLTDSLSDKVMECLFKLLEM